MSLIVCAYNEEKHIRQKISNCLALDYPKDKLEIIVVSDGSNDSTAVILEGIKHPLIQVHVVPERRGKAACQNLAVETAKNDILFFTDATICHPQNALRLLVRSFQDSSVGCVTGKPVFALDDGCTSKGLNKREKYELFLRSRLGELHSLFGATDCMYAIPRRLYVPIRPDLDSGFVGPLKLLERGYRTIYEPEALAFVNRPAPGVRDEFARRSRIVLRGMRGLLHMNHLMNPFRYGFSAVALFSSRFLRWLTPLFLGTLFVSNVFLLDQPRLPICLFPPGWILYRGFRNLYVSTVGVPPWIFFLYPTLFLHNLRRGCSGAQTAGCGGDWADLGNETVGPRKTSLAREADLWIARYVDEPTIAGLLIPGEGVKDLGILTAKHSPKGLSNGGLVVGPPCVITKCHNQNPRL